MHMCVCIHVSAYMRRHACAIMYTCVDTYLYWSQTWWEPYMYVEEGEKPNHMDVLVSHEAMRESELVN